MTATSVLNCANVTFSYGATERLKNINLSFSGNELVALYGHNGSGKSTLLKILGGSLRVSKGVVLYNGQSALNQGFLRSELRKELGLVFQSKSSDEKLTLSMNLYYGALLMGLSKAEAQKAVAKTLIQADLAKRAHEPVKKLSGGMQRRLELYRTFMHRPKIVLLDEPTAGLDVFYATKFLDFLKSYQRKEQAIVIMANHQPSELLLCDRVVMLKDGEVTAIGSPQFFLEKLNFIKCQLSFTDFEHGDELLNLGMFDICAKGNQISGKISATKLDGLLMSSLLRSKICESFSLEKPNLADAYEALTWKQ